MNDYTKMVAGMDVGDRLCEICILDDQGEVIERKRISATQQSLKKFFSRKQKMVVAMESGFHSPWMSRVLDEIGVEVIVANSRRVALIAKNNNKTDRVDAELLARLARSDKRLLSPIEHRSKEHQKHMAMVRSRDALIRSRTLLVNHVRGTVKSFGARLPSTATQRFHKLKELIPEDLLPALAPLMSAIEEINGRITLIDGKILALCQESYPETETLRQVPGVGPLTSLVFILAISDPNRFGRNRDVGPYLGMVPRNRQSGDDDPQLRITRAGNVYLRRLLVNAAHYILGPFGPDSKLRSFGLEMASRGGTRAKKKAVVAVARKLAVLLMALWKDPQDYQPFPDIPERRRRTNESKPSSTEASSGRDILMDVALPAARQAANH